MEAAQAQARSPQPNSGARRPPPLLLLLASLSLLLGRCCCNGSEPNDVDPNAQARSSDEQWSNALAVAADLRRQLSIRWPRLLPTDTGSESPLTLSRLNDYVCTTTDHSSLPPVGGGRIPWVRVPRPAREKLGVVLDKAARGGEVVVAVVGGSVSAGGTLTWQASYVSVFAKLLASAFPNAQVRLELGARGDSTSTLTGFCLEALVGTRVDVLFVEFTMNDGVEARRWKEPITSSSPSGATTYENLLRRAAATYPSAAIFGVGFWGQYFALGQQIYAKHAALAAHYGLGWVAVDPLGRALLKSRMSTRAKTTTDQKGHPREEIYQMIAQLMLVGMVEETACELRSTPPSEQLPPSATTPRTHSLLPDPINSVLRREPSLAGSHCDMVGLPKQNATSGELQGVSVARGWQYVSIRWQGASHPRRDQKLHLIPQSDLRKALKLLEKQRAKLEGGKVASVKRGEEELRVSVNVVSRLLVSVCRETFYQALYDGKCFPFRVFLEPSGMEVRMRPWLGRKYGIFVSSVPLPRGEHSFRIVRSAERKCRPYPCLAAVVGL